MAALWKLIKWTLRLAVLAVVALGAWLYLSPPDLIRVATSYSAKIVCSNVFILIWLADCAGLRCKALEFAGALKKRNVSVDNISDFIVPLSPESCGEMLPEGAKVHAKNAVRF